MLPSQKHRRGTYTTLLTLDNLNEYLYDIDEQAAELMEMTVTRLAEVMTMKKPRSLWDTWLTITTICKPR